MSYYFYKICSISIFFFQGIIQGAIYALIALGLTLVYGLLRILHVAHASLFTLGGYVGVVVTNATGSFVFAMFLSIFVVGFCWYVKLQNNL